MAFDLYVDSSANIPDDLLIRHHIGVIPYPCIVNGEERRPIGEGMSFREAAQAFYAEMRAGADVKTSLVSQEAVEAALAPSLKAGKDVLLVVISSGISGTYQQALRAREALLKAYKGRKIFVCDSSNASLGEGLLALKAADLRDMGESIEACAEWIENNRYRMNSYFTVGDLRYLRKGGRISAALAIAGTLLNIKPVLRADGSPAAKLAFASKEKGRKKALAALVRAFDENVERPEGQTVAITHADCEEDALAVAHMLEERGVRNILIEYYDICSGTHAGPGTVALFFLGKDRRGEIAGTEKQPAGKRVPVKL